ncbi:MAG: hypothetical protein J3K34DRAFT_457799 [Monoraphidium minutum]|nr:MAG: hypothetical protein J3K34DRAFT_457799 [Monoraphidium minutum]
MNAALYLTDRPEGRTAPQDAPHRLAMTEAQLSTTDPWAPGYSPRARTLRVRGEELSRIDDILVNRPRAAANSNSLAHQLGDEWDTDHNLLAAQIPWRDLGLFPAPALAPNAPPARQRALCWPVRADKWQQFQSAFAGEAAATFGALEREITGHIMEQVLPHWEQLERAGDPAAPAQALQLLGARPAHDVIAEMTEAAMKTLARGQDLLMEICPTRPLNPEGYHYRPRQTNKRYVRLREARALARRLLTLCDAGQLQEQWPIAVSKTLREHLTMAGWDNTAIPGAEQLRTSVYTTKAAIRKIDREHKTQARQRAEKTAERRAYEAPRLSNRIATGKHKPRSAAELKVLADPEGGEPITDPSIIKRKVEQFITKKAAPPRPKTGQYTNATARRYRWEEGDKDGFPGLIQPPTDRIG